MFTRMDHVAMSVQDMEKCIAFYRDVIGFEKVFDREFDVAMGKLIGIEGTRVRIVHMQFHENKSSSSLPTAIPRADRPAPMPQRRITA
jgi:catechol 2,3-dioxygenase-like lactoylglutathione lyase family enzyme